MLGNLGGGGEFDAELLPPLLGHGTEALVHRARVDGVECALKVERGESGQGLEEFWALRRLSGIAGVLQPLYGTERVSRLELRRGLFVSRYSAIAFPIGTPLPDWMSKCSQNSRSLALLHLAQSLYHTLCHVHQRGVVHRDVKPDNVIVFSRPLQPDQDDTPLDARLADFGWAFLSGTKHDGTFGGSDLFASEEALAGEVPCDRHDMVSLVYSLFSLEEPSLMKPKPSLNDVLRTCADSPWLAFLGTELPWLSVCADSENVSNNVS